MRSVLSRIWRLATTPFWWVASLVIEAGLRLEAAHLTKNDKREPEHAKVM